MRATDEAGLTDWKQLPSRSQWSLWSIGGVGYRDALVR